jgi:succinate dehydrogenase/fumarate reductase-like Fe-S protein
MSLLLRRAPPRDSYLQPEWQEKMDGIETCIECGTSAAAAAPMS